MIEKSKIADKKTGPENELLSRSRVLPSSDEHQMEFVTQIAGVAYINDAHSTTLNTTCISLKAIEAPVILITGGNDVLTDYSLMADIIKEKVIAILYLGESGDRILKHCINHTMLYATTENIREAVGIANAYSRSGDVVLFSPACAGNDPTDPYKGRGGEFKKTVKELI